MNYFESRPLSILGFFAIPLLIFLFWMGHYLPGIAVNGYQNLIIAFEFIFTPKEVTIIFGVLNANLIEAIDMGNKIDFGFMLVYSGFFFLLFRRLRKFHQFEYAVVGQALAILMLLADTIENFQLLHITSLFPDSNNIDIENTISILQIATWTKWLSISAALSLAGSALWENYGLAAKILSLLLSLPIVLGARALVKLDASSIELFTASIFGAIGLLVLSCYLLKPVVLKLKI